jgi:hypothetical protein
MSSQNENDPEHSAPADPARDSNSERVRRKRYSMFAAQLDDMLNRPYRHPLLHWGAFVLALASLVVLIIWASGARIQVTLDQVWLDIGISVIFAIEFVTRSGFRWNPITYSVSHFFDFVALAPALALVYYDVPFQGVWIWIILAARVFRAVDRLLGDGFVRRNALALAEGFEEEITDRVLLRIIDRVRTEVGHGSLAGGLAQVLRHNRDSVLQRVEAQHPQHGLVASVAQLSGLDDALKKVEERTYDAVVEVVNSPEVDRAVRESIDSAFTVIESEIGAKSWRRNLGFGRRRSGD